MLTNSRGMPCSALALLSSCSLGAAKGPLQAQEQKKSWMLQENSLKWADGGGGTPECSLQLPLSLESMSL